MPVAPSARVSSNYNGTAGMARDMFEVLQTSHDKERERVARVSLPRKGGDCLASAGRPGRSASVCLAIE